MNKIALSLISLIFILSCKKKEVPTVDYATEMRQFVIEIAADAKAVNPNFLVIPQNGAALVTISTNKDSVLALDYIAAIDGQGQEDLHYGYDKDDKATREDVTASLDHYLGLLEANEIEVLTTDYCNDIANINNSYAVNEAKGYISFAATDRNLTNIPDDLVNAHNENTTDIVTLNDAKNFLYLLNPSEKFDSKATFITAVQATDYDVIIMDRDFNDEQFTAAEIGSLKTKADGGSRLVICYMSIGEAEDYRSYWNKDWEKNKTSPDWLYLENKRWRGNYKVFYWMPEWKAIIYGNEASYLTSIVNLGFDGTYLDIIDAYEYYNEL